MQARRIQFISESAAVAAAVLCVASATLTGCSASRNHNGATQEATGAQLGGSLGERNGQDSGTNVLESYMEEQAVALVEIDGPTIDRFGAEIKVTWASAILFDFDSAMLKQSSRADVTKMAEIFVEYPETHILITGHTDTEGEDNYNQKLSERRAMSVRNYLETAGVASSRLETIGFGALRPIAANDTEEGRLQNQRVEIIVRANETLRQRAAGGE